jgi:hypothetical protein
MNTFVYFLVRMAVYIDCLLIETESAHEETEFEAVNFIAFDVVVEKVFELEIRG